MERDKVKRIVGTTPGDEYDLQVPWSVRLTNSGEFIHAASWNGGNIGQRSTSNGCTNLNLDAAQQYFNSAKIGDVAVYVNTGGAPCPSGTVTATGTSHGRSGRAAGHFRPADHLAADTRGLPAARDQGPGKVLI